MLYIVALLCPPLAVLLCGRPFSAILVFFLWLCFWFPGSLVAFLIVSDHYENRRFHVHVSANAVARSSAQASSHNVNTNVNTNTNVVHVHVHHGPGSVTVGSPPEPVPPPKVADPELPPIVLEPVSVREPRKPTLTMAEVMETVVNVRVNAVRAYGNLPEWAQPICWGLGAGSCLSMVGVVVVLFRR